MPIGKFLTGSALALVPVLAFAQVPPPPVVIPAPAPPARVVPGAVPRMPQRQVVMAVQAYGGEELLMNRELRQRGYAGAQVELQVTQAGPLCAADDREGYNSQQRTGLRLRISPRGNGERFEVDATWTRPVEACAAPGTRSAGLNIGIEVPPGQSRTVTGDGGLRIVLTHQR